MLYYNLIKDYFYKHLRQEFLQNLLDILYPRSCMYCGARGTFICEDCMQQVVLVEHQRCFGCDVFLENARLCKKCRQHYFFDKMIICAYYTPLLQSLIKRFKYRFSTELSLFLSEILYLQYRRLQLEFDLVTEVPLHSSRQRWRAFNQSSLLAKVLSARTGIFYAPLLTRIRATRPQSELKAVDRATNVAGAFSLIEHCNHVNLKHKTILLIDDVIGSGATLHECARVLKNEGAREVIGMVLGSRKGLREAAAILT